MDVTFKNVGQGDSIMIEWQGEDGTDKIGIIDCNVVNKQNPVLEYIKSKEFKVIDFIVISHPHDDHYSGFIELLDFIEDSNIIINWFGHTIKEIGQSYWQYFDVGFQASYDLDYILKKGICLKKKGLLKKWEIPTERWRIELDKDIYLESLSPSHDEIQTYQRLVKLDAKVNRKQASMAANLLSTVFKITSKENNFLLTSDAVLETFERLYTDNSLQGIELIGVQIPHHGSINNFSNSFWSSLNPKKVKKLAIASAGQNLKYKHPHLEVLKKCEEHKFQIHCTNIVHGMEEYTEVMRKSLILDGISDEYEDNLEGGDKKFSF